jgi:hypothetical protein
VEKRLADARWPVQRNDQRLFRARLCGNTLVSSMRWHADVWDAAKGARRQRGHRWPQRAVPEPGPERQHGCQRRGRMRKHHLNTRLPKDMRAQVRLNSHAGVWAHHAVIATSAAGQEEERPQRSGRGHKGGPPYHDSMRKGRRRYEGRAAAGASCGPRRCPNSSSLPLRS